MNCETQDEIDTYWALLSEGSQTQPCGWPQDKSGVSWQIVPGVLGDMLKDEDAARSSRRMQAMLKMTKLDIKRLKQAYDQV